MFYTFSAYQKYKPNNLSSNEQYWRKIEVTNSSDCDFISFQFILCN